MKTESFNMNMYLHYRVVNTYVVCEEHAYGIVNPVFTHYTFSLCNRTTFLPENFHV